jgi:hypothetical protein
MVQHMNFRKGQTVAAFINNTSVMILGPDSFENEDGG